jgi:hypothetical protein
MLLIIAVSTSYDRNGRQRPAQSERKPFMRKINNKWPLWALVAVLIVSAALGGCGGQAAEGNAPGEDAEGTMGEDAPGSAAGKPAAESAGETIPPEQEEEKPQLPLGLYINNGSGIRVLTTTVDAAYTTGKDIVVLSAFLSAEPEISGGTFAPVWSDLWEAAPEAADCKIGYRLTYEIASGETVSQTILGPQDTEVNRDFVETYLYDDIHQDGWYSHLLLADVTAQTIATTIKLTGGPEVSVVGDIAVEAFLYEGDPTAEPLGRWEVVVSRE